ncbi:uncharacterized protein LOC106736298 [Tupaia chinensis]|uniref:uncharacterized protein LOC106736298 n=1 Tax=Tupaia chinensis TaxID=246437 RepID=UPI000703E977|nr:uncharacterized protein LOC106736298 [Tupaia chinensis]
MSGAWGSVRGNCCLQLFSILVSLPEENPRPSAPAMVGGVDGGTRPSLPPPPVQPCPGSVLVSGATAPAAPWGDGIGGYRGSPPAAPPCRLFCCPWCPGQGPRRLSPHSLPYKRVSHQNPNPHSLRVASPQLRDYLCYATGLQPPSPKTPCVAVAQHFPRLSPGSGMQTACTNRSSRSSHSVVQLMLLSVSDVSAEHASGSCTFNAGLPSCCSCNHFAHVQNGIFCSLSIV